MRDLSFYQKDPSQKRAPRQVSIEKPAFMATAWNSETWKELIRKYSDYPLCIDSQSIFAFNETSIRNKIADLREIHLERQLPKKTLEDAKSSKSIRCIQYSNPRPYEKICVRISVFGSKIATEAPEDFTLVIHFFSQRDQRPITSYIEDISCILN